MGTVKGAKKARNKGKRWERQFARELSLWWSEDKDPDIFRRSFGSRTTVDADSQGRDIMAVKKEGYGLTKYINFELKNREDIDLWKELSEGKKDKGHINQWFDEGLDTKEEFLRGKELFLILKKNRKDCLLCIEYRIIPMLPIPPIIIKLSNQTVFNTQ